MKTSSNPLLGGLKRRTGDVPIGLINLLKASSPRGFDCGCKIGASEGLAWFGLNGNQSPHEVRGR